MAFNIPFAIDEVLLKLIITFVILIMGLILSKTGEKIISTYYRKKYKLLKKAPLAKTYSTAVWALFIIAALLFLQIDISNNLFVNAYKALPGILSIVLVLILVIVLVNLIIHFIKKFLSTTGLIEYLDDTQNKYVLDLILWVLRIVLYLLLGLAGFEALGYNVGKIISTFGTVLYPLFILLLLFIFFGFKDAFQNFFIGLYLKGNKEYRTGHRIRVNGEVGTIKNMGNQDVLVLTDQGNNLFIPNRLFINQQKIVKKVMSDLDSLQKIKEHFVAQHPSYCGPATASMILNMFGYEYSQDEIGKAAKTKKDYGTHPNDLIKVLKKITKDQVKGVWIDTTMFNDLKVEMQSWLNDGALLIVDYRKNVLFPAAKKAHYSACLGIEGDDAIILDPSPVTGGVYFVNINLLYRGMDTYSKVIQGKRGYIVLAPTGTTAYERMEDGLIFYDISLYKKLNKNFRKNLKQLIQNTKLLEFIIPDPVKDYMSKFRPHERVSRVWQVDELTAKNKK